jgi:hypothetical protein
MSLNAILYGINNSVLSKLQTAQNTAARLITRKRKYDHITPELMDLYWLPIKYRCKYKLLLYTFKVLTEHAPVYLQELLAIHVPTRSLRSENSICSCRMLLGILFHSVNAALSNWLSPNVFVRNLGFDSSMEFSERSDLVGT